MGGVPQVALSTPNRLHYPPLPAPVLFLHSRLWADRSGVTVLCADFLRVLPNLFVPLLDVSVDLTKTVMELKCER